MFHPPRAAWLLGLLSLSACADPALEKRVVALEQQIAELKASGARPGAPAGVPPSKPGAQMEPSAPSPEEEAAGALFREANQLAEQGNYEGAKGKLAELDSKYGATRTAKRAARLKQEIAVIGTSPGEPAVQKWFNSPGNFSSGKATLVVFWETWCPHCQREVPKMVETNAKFKSKGLNIVALTKVTRTSTDEKVSEFIAEHKLDFPIGKEDASGSTSQKLNIQGIPAAAIIKNGTVVWRGHPGQLDDAKLESFLNG